jgi:hypothetical protein
MEFWCFSMKTKSDALSIFGSGFLKEDKELKDS